MKVTCIYKDSNNALNDIETDVTSIRTVRYKDEIQLELTKTNGQSSIMNRNQINRLIITDRKTSSPLELYRHFVKATANELVKEGREDEQYKTYLKYLTGIGWALGFETEQIDVDVANYANKLKERI